MFHTKLIFRIAAKMPKQTEWLVLKLKMNIFRTKVKVCVDFYIKLFNISYKISRFIHGFKMDAFFGSENPYCATEICWNIQSRLNLHGKVFYWRKSPNIVREKCNVNLTLRKVLNTLKRKRDRHNQSEIPKRSVYFA